MQYVCLYSFCTVKRCFDLGPRRVIFRAWECFHSIREQILHRSWCSKNFPTFPKNIFSIDPKTFSENFWKFSEISTFSKILTKFLKGNFLLKISLYKFSKDFWKFWDFRKFPKNFKKYFWIDRKNIFRKSWKKIRTSRSKQNLAAARMEALSASEKHSRRL